MFTHMDIFLAIAIFLLTSAIAYLGVRVTLHPAETEVSKIKYKLGFVFLTAIAAGLILWQSIMNRKEQGELHSQLNKIQKNTETPPQVTVNVPQSIPPQIIVNPSASSHSTPHSSALLQLTGIQILNAELVAGSNISTNVYVGNKGNEPAYDVVRYFAVGLVPLESDPDKQDSRVHAEFLKAALANQRKQVAGHTIGVGEQAWNTLPIGPLTQEQVDGFVSGKHRLYVYAWARWKSALHDLDACRWIQSPGAAHVPVGTPIVVHDCS